MDSGAARCVRSPHGRGVASDPWKRQRLYCLHTVSAVSESAIASQSDSRVTALEALSTLFALGREVTSVLDLDELLQKIPQIIGRITKFKAFAVYLLDRQGEELTIAYSVGYPEQV